MIGILRRLRYLFPSYRRAYERDMQQELEALREIADARELGSLTIAAENARSVFGFSILQGINSDVRYSLRALRRDRTFTAITVISLAAGIASNVAIFGIMNALLWRELPIRNPDQLVAFENTSRSYFGYSEFAKHSSIALQDVIAQSSALAAPVDAGSGQGKAAVEFVSGGYFHSLGIEPALGRLLLSSDDRMEEPRAVAVLRHAYWRRAFGSDLSVIGRSIHVGRGRFQIVGVAPSEFFGLSIGEAPDVWVPLTAYSNVFAGDNWLLGRNTNWLDIFGRLRPGLTLRQATTILTPVSLEIDIERNNLKPSQSEREKMLRDSIRLQPAARGISYLRVQYSRPLQVIGGMLFVGLALICINVLSLQIARADERQKELAIRMTIGGSRFRIIRQHFLEALLFAGLSGLGGLLLFRPATGAIASLMKTWSGAPAQMDLGIDAELVVLVVCLCIAVAFITGFLPAFYSGGRDLQQRLQKRSQAMTSRHRRLIVNLIGTTQLAVSFVLITGACLFAFSLHQLRQFDGGINRDKLVEVEISELSNATQPEQAIVFENELRKRCQAVPGVESVTFSQNGIYSGRNYTNKFEAEGSHPTEGDEHYGTYDYVGPNFFTTLGTRVLAGRDFDESDNATGPKVAIVNQTFATRVFHGKNAVGRNLYVGNNKSTGAYRIIGVVRDVRAGLRSAEIMWYFPALQHSVHAFGSRFLIRSKVPAKSILASLESTIHSRNSEVRITSVETADNLLNATLATDRLLARMGWGFGGLALLLASAGIYGLLSYEVVKRTSEIGIRSALGARRADIMELVLSQVAVLVAVGLLVGSVAALMLTRLVQGLVFGIRASDYRIELVAAATLTGVAFAAAIIPAVRAASIDPMKALRAE